MVDPERLHRILRRVSADLAVLRRYAEVPAAELEADPARLGHVKYLFITCIEGCVDAAHHVGATQGYEPPGTNAEAMLLLARHGVLTDPVAAALAQAVGFRNVLVHGYATVDDGRVVAYLAELDDIGSFVDQMASLLPKAN